MASSLPTFHSGDKSRPSSRPHISNSSKTPLHGPIDTGQGRPPTRESRFRTFTGLTRLRIETCIAERAYDLHPPPSIEPSPATADLKQSLLGSETKDLGSPSAPIPIPDRHISPSWPKTPLTAREIEGGHFPFHDNSPKKPQLSQSLRPSYQLRPAPRPSNHIDTLSPESDCASKSSSTPRRSVSSSLYRPSSPLSPTMPRSTLQSNTSTRSSKHPGKNLHLSSLPRFHPANYQSPETGNIQTLRASRPGSAGRQFSDAIQKLHHYQRDLGTSRSLIGQSTATKPSSPHLHPLGSPGPVTPMTLEGHDDYLSAGASRGDEDVSQGDDGGLISKLVREENERVRDSGLLKRHSPVASPAGRRD